MKKLMLLAAIASISAQAGTYEFTCTKPSVKGKPAATIYSASHSPENAYWVDFTHTGGDKVAALKIMDDERGVGFSFQDLVLMIAPNGNTGVFDTNIPTEEYYYRVFTMQCEKT